MTTSILKSIENKKRDQIMGKISSHITILSQHGAVIKASLNIPWNQIRQMSRWLRKFKIKVTPKKRQGQ